MAAPGVLRMMSALDQAQQTAKNVIVVVFDAFSAMNMSMHGYHRPTTPNLSRLAKKAILYHNHYAASTFTSPGTASLLTGTLPWTHRAILRNGRVAEPLVPHNVFSVFPDYYRMSYTHNEWADTLLRQFAGSIDYPMPVSKLYLRFHDGFIKQLFPGDIDIASVGWTRDVNLRQETNAYSLFLSHLYGFREAQQDADLIPLYPRGIPATESAGNYFLLDAAIDWIGGLLPTVPKPYFGYFHLLPPHFPYRAEVKFCDAFRGDGFKAVPKPIDVFAYERIVGSMGQHRREYDEFILNVDSEFNRLYESLERSGVLEDSWLILTSDHGELFERGMMGHLADALYQPLIRVPLIIFEPGRQAGLEIYSRTSGIDLLPTLAHLTGHTIPDWCEGSVLPPFNSESEGTERPLFVVECAKNNPAGPLTRASTAIVRDNFKLLWYFGYTDRGIDELVKLYDVEADPEELTDLYPTHQETARQLLAELKASVAQADQPFL